MPRKRTFPTETVQATAWELIRTGTKPTNDNVKAALGRRGGTDSIAGDLRAMDARGLWKRMRPTSVRQAPRALTPASGAAATLPPQAKATSKSNKCLLAEIAHLKETVARLERELAKARVMAEHQAPISNPSKPKVNSNQIPFEEMSISDAAIHMLEEHGQPMTTWRIAYALETEGFNFVKEPSRAVNNALFKRARKRQDVIRVGYSTWGLPSRDKPGNIRTNISYSSNTDKDYQVERMQLSHQNARERGMSVGRPAFEKTHPFSVILEYRRLRESGAGIYQALDACGITRSSYSKYRSAIEDATSEAEFCEATRRIRQDAHSS
jgi:hypothetical protein